MYKDSAIWLDNGFIHVIKEGSYMIKTALEASLFQQTFPYPVTYNGVVITNRDQQILAWDVVYDPPT